MRQAFAELLGTFALVFVGTGAIVVNDLSAGSITHAGVALAFGLVVTAMIFALGEISGAHLNPAVTLGLACAERAGWRRAAAYVVAQSGGAVLASSLIRVLFPTHATWGSTAPAGSNAQSFALEVVLTFFLVLVILSVASGGRERNLGAPFAVGAVVAFDALLGGPVSGASMNPARSLGPAIVSGRLEHLWLYATAPCIGSLLAVAAWALLQRRPSRLIST